MALPYPMAPVSPFDVITSQAENEKIANIESLADGTGIGNNAISTAKIADNAVTASKLDSATLSTTEKIVGYTDTGDTIYCRVFNGSITADAGVRIVTTIAASGIQDIISAYGYFRVSGGRSIALGQSWANAGGTTEASGSAVFYDPGVISLVSRSEMARSNSPYKLILKYTKV